MNNLFSKFFTRSSLYQPFKRFVSNPSATLPPISKPVVGHWYLASGSLVFGIVVLGGLTRLTESGLSITEWNVIKGMKPPTSQEEWDSEFEKYKQFPEYKLLNRNMTLPEFKFIFFMEWAHRMWGRFIGLSFILPGAYFAYKGYMSPAIQKRSLVIGSLIGFQGLLGWLMVRSGLDPEIEETNSHPRVSHYWLTAHLGSAFVIYSSMLVTGLEILKLHRTSLKPQQVIQKLNSVNSLPMTQFKRAATATAGLVFLTALSGAMVAGLDAGLIYNEFPFMGLGLIPSDMWAFSTESPQNPDPLPWWRNLLENPSAVQFNHRVLAVSTATVIAGLGFYSRRLPLTPHSRLAMNVLLGVTCVQVGLGISTLLYFVPVPLAASHQAGSLTLLSAALWLVHTLRRLPK